MLARVLLQIGALLLLLTAPQLAVAQSESHRSATQVLADASQSGAYSFLIFYRHNDPATQALARTVNERLGHAPASAEIAFVQVTNPSETALVAKYGAARAPVPLLVAVAPNGAITGVYPRRFTAADMQEAFVSPCTMQALKGIQDGRLVFIAIKPSADAPNPSAIADFGKDALFRDRMAVVPLVATDAPEQPFLKELKVVPESILEPLTVVMAPPGALVGKFAASATKDQIAAALADAGKCCDDPNCKHHKKAQAKQPNLR